MLTRDELIKCALEHSDHAVGYAFCKALGVLHLVGKRRADNVYEDAIDRDVLECFNNYESPMNKRFA